MKTQRIIAYLTALLSLVASVILIAIAKDLLVLVGGYLLLACALSVAIEQAVKDKTTNPF